MASAGVNHHPGPDADLLVAELHIKADITGLHEIDVRHLDALEDLRAQRTGVLQEYAVELAAIDVEREVTIDPFLLALVEEDLRRAEVVVQPLETHLVFRSGIRRGPGGTELAREVGLLDFVHHADVQQDRRGGRHQGLSHMFALEQLLLEYGARDTSFGQIRRHRGTGWASADDAYVEIIITHEKLPRFKPVRH